MKLTIERGTLLKSLGHVQSVVERRNTIPILSNVQIEATDGALALTATDLDLAMVDHTEAQISQPGATTVPAHTLFDIVRKLADGAEVEMSMEADQRLVLSSGRSRFTLACLPKEDFPVMAEGDLPHSFQIGAAELKRMVEKTRFAISTEETRYYLNGIYLHVTDGDTPMLRAVATDGHRLARVEMPAPAGTAGMPGVIVPRKTVGELGKLLDEHDGDVSIALSDTKIRFSFGGAVLTSKLIDGTYPDYAKVIPIGNDKVLEVDGHSFSEAVDRVSTISTERTRSVKVGLEGDKIMLAVSSPENGTATEEVAASFSGDPMEVGFNARYLMDILAQVGGDVVRAELADPASPTVILDTSDEGALYVLMPMRV